MAPYIFFAIPVIILVFFIFSLAYYMSAKNKNKTMPDTYSIEELIKRKKILRIATVILVTLVVVVVGFIILSTLFFAYM